MRGSGVMEGMGVVRRVGWWVCADVGGEREGGGEERGVQGSRSTGGSAILHSIHVVFGQAPPGMGSISVWLRDVKTLTPD